jgi:hypothetical protein
MVSKRESDYLLHEKMWLRRIASVACLLAALAIWPRTRCGAAVELPVEAPLTDPCAVQCTAPSIQEVEQHGDTGAIVLGALKIMIPAAVFVTAQNVPYRIMQYPFFLGLMSSSIIDGVETIKDSQPGSTSNYWVVNRLEKFISENTEYELCRMKQLFGNYFVQRAPACQCAEVEHHEVYEDMCQLQ